MENVINKFRIPLDKQLSRVVVSVKKDDACTRKLCITLTSNGNVYPLEGVTMAIVKGIKPDGTIIYNDCVIDCNEIQYTITSQTIAEPGLVNCELELFGHTPELITSARFDIYVYDSVFDDDVIESTDEFKALAELRDRYEKIYEEVIILEDSARKSKEAAEAAQKASEASAQEAKTQATKSEWMARRAAESEAEAKKQAANAAESAGKAKESEENAKSSAEDASQKAEDAENSKTAAEAAAGKSEESAKESHTFAERSEWMAERSQESAEYSKQYADMAKEAADTATAYGAILKNRITIPAEGWQPYGDGVSIEIPDIRITEKMIPVIAIPHGSAAIARACELATSCESLKGAIRLYAKKAPTEDIEADSMYTSEFLKVSGDLPVATKDSLGCVKIDEYIDVTEDGAISANDEELLAAMAVTDAEIEEMINEVFG